MQFDTPCVSLPANLDGRDFCIGDLHGCLPMLRRLMDAVAFDYGRDRLFSVGDLIHRGPDSLPCLMLTREPWFYPVLGNHEALQIGAYKGKRWLDDRPLHLICEMEEAGEDIQGARADQDALRAIMERMPLAIEVALSDGRRVGIVHGGLLDDWSWSDVRAMTQRMPELELPLGSLQQRLLWDRYTAQAAIEISVLSTASNPVAELGLRERYAIYRGTRSIPGIDLLVSGHTPSTSNLPLQAGMRMFLDTGAGYPDGRLTMVELAATRFWQVSDPRNEPEMPVAAHKAVAQVNVDLPWLTDFEIAESKAGRWSWMER